jgi:hypothetical protein
MPSADDRRMRPKAAAALNWERSHFVLLRTLPRTPLSNQPFGRWRGAAQAKPLLARRFRRARRLKGYRPPCFTKRADSNSARGLGAKIAAPPPACPGAHLATHRRANRLRRRLFEIGRRASSHADFANLRRAQLMRTCSHASAYSGHEDFLST